MKKLIVPASILALLFSCGSPEEQVTAPFVDSTSLIMVDTVKKDTVKVVAKVDSVKK